MKQMIKETAPEVKRESSPPSRNLDHIHRYSKRKSDEIGALLSHRSQEECCQILQRVGAFQMFPGLQMTNIHEAALFYQVDEEWVRETLWRGRRHDMRKENKKEFPVVRVKDFICDLKKVSPDCKCAILEGYLYVGRGEVAMKTGFFKSNSQFRIVTPKGMIIMAYRLANGRSEDNRRVAKLVVDECERTGIFEKEAPPVKSEPIPADPTPESPKLDPAQTLTQMFNAMLTLLMKESEERGAEKIVQKLKEAGKL